MNPAVDSARDSMPRLSIAAWLIALLSVVLLTGWVAGGSVLIGRSMWMDEIHSWLIVTDDSLPHAMGALADGADFNPPGWYVVTRWTALLTGEISETRLRLISLFWMLFALAGVFLITALHLGPARAATGVLLSASHPLLVHQSTEIRFYGFWCAMSVWLCLILQFRPVRRSVQMFQAVLLVLLSSLTATCHYFGILSLGLLCLPLIIRVRRDAIGAGLAAIVIMAGTLSLVCCLPFLAGQKAALSRPTWISPPTLSDSIQFLQAILPSWQTIVCVLAVIVSLVQSRQRVTDPFFRSLPGPLHNLLPLAALLMMPLVIVAVSWLLQPALVTRYAIVGLPATAVIFACLLHQCTIRVQGAVCLLGIAGLGWSVHSYTVQWNSEQAFQTAVVDRITTSREDDVVLFEDRIQWFPVRHYNPGLAQTCFLADFSDNQLVKDSSLRIVQRDVGRRIEKWYPDYSMRSIDELSSNRSFRVIPYPDEPPGLVYPESFQSRTAAPPVWNYIGRHLSDAMADHSSVR